MVHPVRQELHFIKGAAFRNIHHCVGNVSPVCHHQENGPGSVKGKETDIVEFLLNTSGRGDGKVMGQG